MPMFQSSVSGGMNWPTERTALNPRPYAVMATPATITINNANPLSSGAFFAAASQAANAAPYPSNVSVFGCGYLEQASTIANDFNFISAKNISSSLSGAVFYKTGFPRVSFITCGTQFAFIAKGGVSQEFLVKINDEYVSVSPTALPTGSPATKYVLVDGIGTAGAPKRVDIIFNLNFSFGGVWVPANETVTPAPRRGRKMALMTDSFGEGTGNEVTSLNAWPVVLQEHLGIDDLIVSCVGGTGLTTAPAPKVKFRDRLARDVLALAPEEIGICLSINDSGASADAVLAEAQGIAADALASLPNIKLTFFAPTINRGIGSVTINSVRQHKSVKAWCAANGHKYVSDIEMPLPQSGRHSATTTAAASANATSLSVSEKLLAGTVYESGDVRFFVRSSTASTATIDKISAAIASGSAITQVGPCYLTGTGRAGLTAGWGNSDVAVSSDNTHPLNYGHQLKGRINAMLYASGT